MPHPPPTSPERLIHARKIALRNGLRHVYTGNIEDPRGQSTYCHACKRALVIRNGFKITGWDFKGRGLCKSCGASCAGVFEERPGSWGSRRAQIQLISNNDFLPKIVE